MERNLDITTNLSTLADTARANTRQNLWRSSAAISLLTKTLQGFGAITTTYVLNAWKLRRRAAFQIHQQICAHTNPSHFDHVPRLPHIESIKFMEPILTADQLPFILQRLLRLNPARPYPTLRTFGRRRRHFQLMQQPPTSDIPAIVTPPPQFRKQLHHRHEQQTPIAPLSQSHRQSAILCLLPMWTGSLHPRLSAATPTI